MKVRVVTSGLLFVFALGTLVLVWSILVVRETRHTAISELQFATERSAAHIGYTLRALELVMRTTSVHVAATGVKEGLQPYLKQLTARLPPIRTITVISPDGIIRTDLRPGEPAKGYKVSDRAYFRAHLPPDAVNEYFYSPPIKSRLDGLTQITLSIAARRGDGELAAVVVSSIDDRFFIDLNQELKGIGRYDARVLYKDGRDVYTLYKNASGGVEHGVFVDILSRLFSGSESVHQKQIAIPYTDLFFELSLPAASYLAQAAPLVIRGNLIIGLILLLMTTIWWLAHRGRVQIMERENRFKDFAETTSDWLWEMDADLRFSYFSDHFPEITGVTQASLFGKTREETGIPDVDSGAWEKHLADLKARRGFNNFVHPRTGLNGQTIWLSISGNPFFDADGVFQGYRGTGTDITELKTAREAKERLSHAVESVPVGIALFDGDDKLVFFNHCYEELMAVVADILKPGVTFEKMIRTIVERQPVKDARGREEEYIQERVEHHRNPTEPFDIRREDKWLLVTETLLPDGSVFTIITDITERKNLEEQLLQAQKMESIGQLTGGIAHDFNNLMSIIVGNLEMAKDDRTDEERNELISNAIGAVDRGASLTQQLLSFSRQQSLSPKVIDANNLVLDSLRLIERTLGENIEIETTFFEKPLLIKIDPSMFGNALLNLALNARDAMPNGGKLSIATTQSELEGEIIGDENKPVTGLYALITVSDTGAGISKDNLGRVVEPFFTTKEVGEGSGLGLSMVYGFIEQSGGYMTIDSKQGKGTTISLNVPLTERQVDKDTEQDASDPSEFQTKTILVVEDDMDVLKTTNLILSDLGYEVLEALDGPSARKILAEKSDEIDLIISDVVMPKGMNGMELAVWAKDNYSHINVLLTSGYPDISRKDALEHAGINLLAKPYKRVELMKAIDNAFIT